MKRSYDTPISSSRSNVSKNGVANAQNSKQLKTDDDMTEDDKLSFVIKNFFPVYFSTLNIVDLLEISQVNKQLKCSVIQYLFKIVAKRDDKPFIQVPLPVRTSWTYADRNRRLERRTSKLYSIPVTPHIIEGVFWLMLTDSKFPHCNYYRDVLESKMIEAMTPYEHKIKEDIENNWSKCK